MPRAIVERRIHQHDIGAVGRKAGGGKSIRAGCNVHRDDLGLDCIRRGVAARKLRQRCVDLDQNELDSGHAPRQRKTRGADAGAEIDHAVARRAPMSPPPAAWRRDRRGGPISAAAAAAVRREMRPR